MVATTALGDTLWATPALASLGKGVSVLTSPVGAQILKNNPHIDQIFSFKEPLSIRFFSLWRKLFKERFETILIFHTSERLVLPLCALLGASRIIGTAGINKGLDSLLTTALPLANEHEIVRRLQIIRAIGAKPTTESLSFFLSPQEALPPRESGPWIALHPGSKDAFKRWPFFAELGNLLKKNLPCEILITGTKEEESLMQEIAAKIPGAHIDRTDRPLREFGSLLNQMDLLISNDTGPVHLACALERPVVAIYTSTDPTLCGPHQAKNAITISRKKTCTPCLKRKCQLPFCFLQIGPDEVAKAACELLQRSHVFDKTTLRCV